jgi:hypothetical protein
MLPGLSCLPGVPRVHRDSGGCGSERKVQPAQGDVVSLSEMKSSLRVSTLVLL